MDKDAHIAYYGNIAIERRYCDDCKGFAFVVDGEIRCCGKKVKEPLPTKHKRMSDVPWKRRGPPRKEKDRILREQGHTCFWCERRFGRVIWRKNRRIVLRVAWDHFVPFSYSLDNRPSNFVASCQVCNGIKSSLMLKDVDEYRIHIRNRWEEKGYSDVRPMWGELPRETPTSKIL